MARANRHYIPGCVWHITHRCHKHEFLLKFGKDRMRWWHWLFEAKKRYGLCVLNYIATSNHIHMLVVDTGEDVIPKSLQLIAGRNVQEYNIRKNRKVHSGKIDIMRQQFRLMSIWQNVLSI